MPVRRSIPVTFLPSSLPDGEIEPKKQLTYMEFLQTTKVIRMLYGSEEARKYFTNNLDVYYNIDNSNVS